MEAALFTRMHDHIEALGYDGPSRLAAAVAEDLAWILVERFGVSLEDAYDVIDDMQGAA